MGGHGRPYPYMMFRNMEALGVTDTRRVAKVGDTVSDIREGKNAGCISIGVIEGSSEMAMAQDEFEALGTDEQTAARERVGSVFRAAGGRHRHRHLCGATRAPTPAVALRSHRTSHAARPLAPCTAVRARTAP